AADCGDGQATADHLAKGDKVGHPWLVAARKGFITLDAPIAARTGPEARQHLVKNEHGSFIARERGDERVESARGADHSHVGGRSLGNDSRNARAVLRE